MKKETNRQHPACPTLFENITRPTVSSKFSIYNTLEWHLIISKGRDHKPGATKFFTVYRLMRQVNNVTNTYRRVGVVAADAFSVWTHSYDTNDPYAEKIMPLCKQFVKDREYPPCP